MYQRLKFTLKIKQEDITMKKRILAYIVSVVILLGTLGFSMPVLAAADENGYEVKVVGRVDTTYEADTYIVEFKIKTLGEAVIGGIQELNIAYDATVLKLVQFNDPKTAVTVEGEEYNKLAHSSFSVISGAAWARSELFGAMKGNTGYLSMQPWKDTMAGEDGKPPVSAPEKYTVFTTIMRVRFAFAAGKTSKDIKDETVRMLNSLELYALNSSNKMFINDDTATYEYGSRDDTPPTLILPPEYDIFAVNFVLGDLNGDGEINILDVNMLYQYVRSIITLDGAEKFAGDVNNDNDVNILDVNMLYQYVRSIITTLTQS